MSTAIAAAFEDIARTLESPAGASQRIRHVLHVTRSLLPYDRCSMLERETATSPQRVWKVPGGETMDESDVVLERFAQVIDGKRPLRSIVRSPHHLALPIVAGGEVIGVILVEQKGAAYGSQDLRLFSAVASQLGSYLSLVRAYEDAQRVARFREEFLAIVGHDLRNPLSVIMTAAHVLIRQGTLDPLSLRIAQRIPATVSAMSRMIEDLLDLTRARLDGGIPLRLADTRVDDVCRRAVREAHAGVAEDVTMTLAPDLDAPCDADRLAQAVSNLVANALRYRSAGTPVRVSATGDADHVRIEVTNQGEPIPGEMLPRLFEPFTRGRSDATDGGLGLGLYIVERIVHAHGGTLSVTSTRAQGTTFAILLPRTSARALDIAPPAKAVLRG